MKKIKNTFLYFIILKNIFIPIYSFIWEYFLNLNGKIYKILFNIKNLNTKFIKLNKNNKILVTENLSSKDKKNK